MEMKVEKVNVPTKSMYDTNWTLRRVTVTKFPEYCMIHIFRVQFNFFELYNGNICYLH